MPYLITENDLETMIREEAEMENSSFVSQDSIRRRIKRLAGDLFTMVCSVSGDFYRKESSFSTVAGISVYDLEGDFFKLLNVYVYHQGTYINLEKFNIREKAGLKNVTSSQYPWNYRLTGKLLNDGDSTEHVAQIELLPTPDAVRTIHYDYLQTFVISEGEQTRTYDVFQAGFEQYIIYGVTALLLSKENVKSAQFYQQEKDREAQRIMAALSSQRDNAEPEKIRGSDDGFDKSVFPWKGDYA